jgi:predicted RNA-binding Zn-ribbon protein involved in translation (DUF1610 family)
MTTETLPASMLARLVWLGAALLEVARRHRDARLEVLEQEVLERVRAAQGGLLEEVVGRATSALGPSQQRVRLACPRCGQRAKVRDWRARRVQTICGGLGFERPWYHCAVCRQGWSPADRTLGLTPRARLSRGLQRWVGEVGLETAFRQGSHLLGELSGQVVSRETIRRHTERQGRAVAAALEQAAATVLRPREAAEAVDPAPGQLLVETDGVLVHYLDDWHELKLGLVGGLVDGELTAPSYVAVRASAEAFGPLLLAEAARRGALEVVGWEGGLVGRGLGVLREVTILGDGAVWIWNLAGEHFGERIEIVDYFHASEHLWTVARLALAERAEQEAWVAARKGELYEQGTGPVLVALQAVRALAPDGVAALQTERGYFRKHAARMDYPRFLALGLPIGSGAIESAAKHLIQQRMKRAGMRWSDAGGHGMAAGLAHRASGRPLPDHAFQAPLSQPRPAA